MDHHAFVHVADADLVPELGGEWLRRGKSLAVEREPVRAIVEDEHEVLVHLLDGPRLPRLHDEGAQ